MRRAGLPSPGMSAVADTVVPDDGSSGAMRPLDPRDIALLEKLGGITRAPVVLQPDAQVVLHRCHTPGGITVVGREGIGQAMNLQRGHRARGVAGAEGIVSARDRGDCSDPIRKGTGHTISHTRAERDTRHIDAMRIDAIVFRQAI